MLTDCANSTLRVRLVFVDGPAPRDCGWSPLGLAWHDARVGRNVGATVPSVCRNNFNRLTLSGGWPIGRARHARWANGHLQWQATTLDFVDFRESLPRPPPSAGSRGHVKRKSVDREIRRDASARAGRTSERATSECAWTFFRRRLTSSDRR